MIIFTFIGNVIAYIIKNVAIIIGVGESIMKVIASIVSLTPTKKDDVIYKKVDDFFSIIKQWLYKISEAFAGK